MKVPLHALLGAWIAPYHEDNRRHSGMFYAMPQNMERPPLNIQSNGCIVPPHRACTNVPLHPLLALLDTQQNDTHKNTDIK